MIRFFTLLLFMSMSFFAIAQSSSLQGSIQDEETKEAILFATIALYKDGVLVTGAESDVEGSFHVKNLDGGTYDLEVSYVGYQSQRITGILVKSGRVNNVDVFMTTEGGVILDEIVVKEYKIPLIEFDNTTQGAVLTSKEINLLPTKSVNGIASLAAGVSSSDDGEGLTFRGSREDATIYYIDGIRVRSSLIPQTEIEQIDVITGGIDAQFGDVTGGIVSITTKGPSSKYSGALELETSQFLDEYGYNLINAGVGGPIIKDTTTDRTILGFRVGGQFRLRKDATPAAVPVFTVKDDVYENLKNNPITFGGNGGFVPTAETLRTSDMQALGYTPNNDDQRIDLTAKLDYQLNDAIDVSLSGNYSIEEGKDNFASWNAFNLDNIPTRIEENMRGNLRFRHRILSTRNNENKVLQNVIYTLHAGYEQNSSTVQSSQHEDNLFRYGYIGRFDREWTPSVTELSVEEIDRPGVISIKPFGSTETFYYAHTGYEENFLGYTASDINPILNRYNNLVNDGSPLNDYIAQNGIVQSSTAHGFHINTGAVFNLFTKSQNDYYNLNLNGSFDLVSKKNKIRHEIKAGILFEQTIERLYSINPQNLWGAARLAANGHLTAVDSGTEIGDFDGQIPNSNNNRNFLQYAPLDQSGTLNNRYFFDRARDVAGLENNQYLNVDALTPDQLSLGLFSPVELTGFQDLNFRYHGYDHTGKVAANNITFEDFFTAKDANGVNTFPVAAFKPSYAAAYIQDKFQIKDIIFRVGLRVDRFASNTKVLKDPYSLYELMDAKDFYEGPASDLTRPGNVQDHYKVYVDSETPNTLGRNKVTAYRDGDQWYDTDGNAVNSGTDIFGTNGLVFGRYYDDRVNNIKAEGYDVNNSFVDHRAEIVLSPRLAFSFPISDFASFFAHYDLLVQRPVNAYASPLTYYFFEDANAGFIGNPNLKSQKTVDYEVGFQQKISASSALKFSAYYKELRDLIQLRTYNQVVSPINSYTTFDNIDFGTVKGFAFEYDLRRTNNIQFRATYTLQFADGTGSDAESQAALSSQGNLRTLAPLNYDERHRFNFLVDYRFDEGVKYNGPKIGDSKILENFGVNLQATLVSGRPYTANQVPSAFGGSGIKGTINGARKPWSYWLNLRVDKIFKFGLRPNGKPYEMTVYFRTQNLLDARNILNVYEATGSAEDDGFFATQEGQDVLANTGSLRESYIDAYNWLLINPNNFSLPRRMFIGAIFSL